LDAVRSGQDRGRKGEADWHKADLTAKLDKMLIYRPGSRGVLTYPEGGKLRVVGTIDLI